MKIGVFTSGRQDWGILRSICKGFRDSSDFDLRLWVGGMHCSKAFGRTQSHIENEGFSNFVEMDWLGQSVDMPAWEQMAKAIQMTSAELVQNPVDAILLAGDRFETLAAAAAATVMMTPIIHLHGGEETIGAIDNSMRHAISKLSPLHFTCHDEYSHRLILMGEDPTTIHNVGAPGLDNRHRCDLADENELEEFFSMKLVRPIVIVTMHPATLAIDSSTDIVAMIEAINLVDCTYVITLPNNDPESQPIREKLKRAAETTKRVAVDALGERRYWGLMRIADAMIGNSSSGIIEAAAIGLPAINIGDRQLGRLRGANVIDVKADAELVANALRKGLSPEFRAMVRKSPSPFGDGNASAKVLSILRGWIPPKPPRKSAIVTC